MIDNFDCSVINLSGYKRLNGSQLVKENITYILNSLKTKDWMKLKKIKQCYISSILSFS